MANDLWYQEHTFNRSLKRNIDDETIIDLMDMIAYESERNLALEDIGFSNNACAIEKLFDYVLDAIGVPEHTEAFKAREKYYEIFYNDYLIERKFKSHSEVLSKIKTLQKDIVIRNEKENGKVVIAVDPKECEYEKYIGEEFKLFSLNPNSCYAKDVLVLQEAEDENECEKEMILDEYCYYISNKKYSSVNEILSDLMEVYFWMPIYLWVEGRRIEDFPTNLTRDDMPVQVKFKITE